MTWFIIGKKYSDDKRKERILCGLQTIGKNMK